MRYNNTRETFTKVIFADMFGFNEAELFEIEEDEQREATQVSFD